MAYDNRSVSPLKITDASYAKQNAEMRRDNPGMASRKTSGTHPDRIKFACRFGPQGHPMKNEKGEPTGYAHALKNWGFGSAAAANSFCRKHKKS